MATQEVPVYQRQEKIQEQGTPDFGNAFRTAAAATNNLSAIGAHVAQSASNQRAELLGYESGKNPHGDLGVPLTEFDKHFAQTYHAQAAATLSTQASQLISDADIELSKPNRLTPELIARSNMQVRSGLDRISADAPTAIKGKLQESFASMMLHQNEQFQKKMISQQREDQGNAIKNSLDLYAKNAYEFSSNGDVKGAENVVNQAKTLAKNSADNRYLTQEQARVNQQTVEQAYLNGKYTKMAIDARANGKLEEFYKNYANNKPSEMDHEQWYATGSAMASHVRFLDSLREQDENLRLAKFNEQISTDPNEVTGAQLEDLRSNTTPLEYQNAHLAYLKAMQKHNAVNAESEALIAGWGNPEVFERGSAKARDAAFDMQVQRNILTARQAGQSLSLSEAEAQVAAQAAGPIPRFVGLLNTKSASINPQDIEDAGKSINYMHQLGKGYNLNGLSDESIAMTKSYQALKQSGVAPVDAAQRAHDNIYNQKEGQKEILNQKWADINNTVIRANGGFANKMKYYSGLTGIDPSKLVDQQGFLEQAEQILEGAFKTTNGDMQTAKEMTMEAIQSSYGDTRVNGKSQTVFLPLEEVVNLPSDSAGFIQQDIIEQVNRSLAPVKEAFDKGESAFYWEIEPRESHVHEQNVKDIFNPIPVESRINEFDKYARGKEIIIHKHWKNGKRETYPLVVKADPWLSKTGDAANPYAGSWDIVLGTPGGWKPLQRLNPMEGELIYYRPDINKIRANYASAKEINKVKK